MSIPQLIKKKRDGEELSKDDIDYLIKSAVSSEMHQAQIGAMLMAMYLKGLSDDETFNLTNGMINSGIKLEWSGLVCDKHSTGGVGDKVSLPLVPALAVNGLQVPMISGRGLGWTGGTLDKLESIPGFNVNLTTQEMKLAIDKCGCFIASTTSDFCPADGIFYKIRDVTSTVDNQSLITGSILSKKIAEGIKYLIMDLKVGKAAFIKDIESGKKLAQKLISVSSKFNVKTRVMITTMDHPIGLTIGNFLEIKETIQCLSGKGPKDLTELVVVAGGELLHMSGKCRTELEGQKMIQKVIQDRTALQKFKDMLIIQGVKESVADDLINGNFSAFPSSQLKTPILAHSSGWIENIDAYEMAMATWVLGGGRNVPTDSINYSVGLELSVQPGDRVQKGDLLVLIHHDVVMEEKLIDKIIRAVKITDHKPEINSRIITVVK